MKKTNANKPETDVATHPSGLVRAVLDYTTSEHPEGVCNIEKMKRVKNSLHGRIYYHVTMRIKWKDPKLQFASASVVIKCYRQNRVWKLCKGFLINHYPEAKKL